MPVAYIALGSNLGDKEKNLEQALDRLRKHGVQVLAVSPWIDRKSTRLNPVT